MVVASENIDKSNYNYKLRSNFLELKINMNIYIWLYVQEICENGDE